MCLLESNNKQYIQQITKLKYCPFAQQIIHYSDSAMTAISHLKAGKIPKMLGKIYHRLLEA